MPTEDEFDFGDRPVSVQQTSSQSIPTSDTQQADEHPAIDAASSVRTTKRYSTDYSSGDKDTAASIKQKEDRMFAIIGSHSIGAHDTGTRVKQLAQEDPQLYAELMQLSADIKNYYERQHGGAYNLWKRVGQEFDFGAANSAWNMAVRIQSQKNNFLGQGWYGFGLGTDTVQQDAVNNAKDFSKSVITAIDSCQPSQLVDILHSIKKYYDYDVKVFESLPDTDANQSALNASLARIEDYLAAWQKCQTKIEQYLSDTAKYKEFLAAYLSKPLTPLSNDEQIYLKTMVDKLSAGQTMRHAQDAADLELKLDAMRWWR